MNRAALAIALAASAVVIAPACEVYRAPPEPSLPQANSDLLSDPAAPVVVAFSKPIDPDSLDLKIARDIVDDHGRLADEADPAGGELSLLFTHDRYDGDRMGTSELSADGMTLTIHPSAPLPINPRLVLIAEPGLKDRDTGAVTVARRKIVFGYQLNLTCSKPSTVLPEDGSYFFIINVTQPLGTQVRLFAKIHVDPTGKFTSEFIHAVRNPDPSRCSPPCATTDACRTLPGPPKCVAPSERSDSDDEYPDLIVDQNPATVFSFVAEGCVVDQPDGTAQFVNLPIDVFVSSPAVTLRNTRLTATFQKDDQGVLRGSGALSADDVALGSISSGKGAGELEGRQVPDDPNIPNPP